MGIEDLWKMDPEDVLVPTFCEPCEHRDECEAICEELEALWRRDSGDPDLAVAGRPIPWAPYESGSVDAVRFADLPLELRGQLGDELYGSTNALWYPGDP